MDWYCVLMSSRTPSSFVVLLSARTNGRNIRVLSSLVPSPSHFILQVKAGVGRTGNEARFSLCCMEHTAQLEVLI